MSKYPGETALHSVTKHCQYARKIEQSVRELSSRPAYKHPTNLALRPLSLKYLKMMDLLFSVLAKTSMEPGSPAPVPVTWAPSFFHELHTKVSLSLAAVKVMMSPLVQYAYQHPSFPLFRTSTFVALGTTAGIGLLISARRVYRTVTNKIYVLSKGQGFSNKGEGRLITRAQKDFTEYMFRSLISVLVFMRDCSYVSGCAAVLAALSDYYFSPVSVSYGIAGHTIQFCRRLSVAVLRLKWIHPDVLYVYCTAYACFRIFGIAKTARSSVSVQVINTINNYATASTPAPRITKYYDYTILLATLDEYSGFRRRAKAFVQFLELIPFNGLYPSFKIWWRRPLPRKDRSSWFNFFTFPIRILLVSLIGKEYFTIPDLLAPSSDFITSSHPDGEISPRRPGPDPPVRGIATSTPTDGWTAVAFVPATVDGVKPKSPKKESKELPHEMPTRPDRPEKKEELEIPPSKPSETGDFSSILQAHPVAEEEKISPISKSPAEELEELDIKRAVVKSLLDSPVPSTPKVKGPSSPVLPDPSLFRPPVTTSTTEITVPVAPVPPVALPAMSTFPEDHSQLPDVVVEAVKKLDVAAQRELHEEQLRIATVASDAVLVDQIYGLDGAIEECPPVPGFTTMGIVRDKRYVIQTPYKILQNNFFFSNWLMTASNSGVLPISYGSSMSTVSQLYTKGAPTPFRARLELQKFSTEDHVPYPMEFGMSDEGYWLIKFVSRTLQIEGRVFTIHPPQDLCINDFSSSSWKAHPGWMARTSSRFTTFSDSFTDSRTWANEVYNDLKAGNRPSRLLNHCSLALPVVKKSASRKPDLSQRCRLALIPEAWHRILYRSAFKSLREHVEKLDPGKQWTSKFSLFYNSTNPRVTNLPSRPNSLQMVCERFKRFTSSEYMYIVWDMCDHGGSFREHMFTFAKRLLSIVTRFPDGSSTEHYWDTILNEALHQNIALAQKDGSGLLMYILKKHSGWGDGNMDTSLWGTIGSLAIIGHMLYPHFPQLHQQDYIFENMTAEVHGDNVAFACSKDIGEILSLRYKRDQDNLSNFGFASKIEEFKITNRLEEIELMSWQPHRIFNNDTYVGVKSIIHPIKSLYYCEKLISDPPTPADVRYMADMTTCLYIMNYWNADSRRLLETFWSHLQTLAVPEDVSIIINTHLQSYLEFRGFTLPPDHCPTQLADSVPYPPDKIKELWLGPRWKKIESRSVSSFRESDTSSFHRVTDMPTNDVRDLLLTGFISEDLSPRQFLGSLSSSIIRGSTFGSSHSIDIRNLIIDFNVPHSDAVLTASTLSCLSASFLPKWVRYLHSIAVPTFYTLISAGFYFLCSEDQRKEALSNMLMDVPMFIHSVILAPIYEEAIKHLPTIGWGANSYIILLETLRFHGRMETEFGAYCGAYNHAFAHTSWKHHWFPFAVLTHAYWNLSVFLMRHTSGALAPP